MMNCAADRPRQIRSRVKAADLKWEGLASGITEGKEDSLKMACKQHGWGRQRRCDNLNGKLGERKAAECYNAEAEMRMKKSLVQVD